MSQSLLDDKLPTDLQKLYESYHRWKTMYLENRSYFEFVGEKESVKVLDMIDAFVEKHRHQWRVLEKLNFEKLSRMVRTPRYPLSIVTWLEDEMKDIRAD